MKVLESVSFYLLWLVSGALSVVDWLALRSAVTAVATAIVSSVPKEVQIERQWYLRWTVPAVDQFALVILGIIAMLSVMSFEYVYRTGFKKGTVKKRFAIVTGIQVGLLIVSGISIFIASRMV